MIADFNNFFSHFLAWRVIVKSGEKKDIKLKYAMFDKIVDPLVFLYKSENKISLWFLLRFNIRNSTNKSEYMDLFNRIEILLLSFSLTIFGNIIFTII